MSILESSRPDFNSGIMPFDTTFTAMPLATSPAL